MLMFVKLFESVKQVETHGLLLTEVFFLIKPKTVTLKGAISHLRPNWNAFVGLLSLFPHGQC